MSRTGAPNFANTVSQRSHLSIERCLTNQGNRRPPRRAAPPVGVRVDRVVRRHGAHDQWGTRRPIRGETAGVPRPRDILVQRAHDTLASLRILPTYARSAASFAASIEE